MKSSSFPRIALTTESGAGGLWEWFLVLLCRCVFVCGVEKERKKVHDEAIKLLGKYSVVNGSSSVTTCVECPAGKYVETSGNDELADCI